MSTTAATSTGAPPPHASNPSPVTTQPPLPNHDNVAAGVGPGGEADVNPKWFSKACADLHASLNASVHSSDDKQVSYAVIQKAGLLWDIGQVSPHHIHHAPSDSHDRF